MKQHFDHLRSVRANLLKTVKDLSIEDLNRILPGFKNNIVWNMGHILATQNNLVYKLSGLQGNLDHDFSLRFLKGSAPDASQPVGQEEVKSIKEIIIELIDRTEMDYDAGVFKHFTPYQTSFGVKLNSVEDAIIFNNLHEGLHLGYTMSLKRAILA